MVGRVKVVFAITTALLISSSVQAKLTVAAPTRLSELVGEVEIYELSAYGGRVPDENRSTPMRLRARIAASDICDGVTRVYENKLVLMKDGETAFSELCGVNLAGKYIRDEQARVLQLLNVAGVLQFTVPATTYRPLGLRYYVHYGPDWKEWYKSDAGMGGLLFLGTGKGPEAMIGEMAALNLTECDVVFEPNDEENVWLSLFRTAGYVFWFRIVVPTGFTLCGFLAGWFLLEHLKARKAKKRGPSKKSNGPASLLVLTIAETVLLIQMTMMIPLGILHFLTGLFSSGTLTVEAQLTVINVFTGVSLSTGMLVTLIWYDARSNIFAGKKSSFSSRHKTKIFSLAALSVFTEGISVLMIIGAFGSSVAGAIKIIGGWYLVGQCAVSFLYLRETTRFVKLLGAATSKSKSAQVGSGGSSSNNQVSEIQKRMVRWLWFSGVAMLAQCFFIGLIGVFGLIATPPGWCGLWGCAYFARTIISLSLIMSTRSAKKNHLRFWPPWKCGAPIHPSSVGPSKDAPATQCSSVSSNVESGVGASNLSALSHGENSVMSTNRSSDMLSSSLQSTSRNQGASSAQSTSTSASSST